MNGRLNLDTITGSRIVIWGAGLDGQAAVEAFGGRCELRVVVDVDVTKPVDLDELSSLLGIKVTAPSAAHLDWADVIIRSPVINPRRIELAGRVVTSLTDLWLNTPRQAPVIGVTGTKGKSTTTLVTTRLLQAAGLTVGMGGNIEVPVTHLADDRDAYVIEVSSYMASDLTRSPDFGILTNLHEDHLTWHGGVEPYRRDKLNLFSHEGLRVLAVNGLDDVSLTATARMPRRLFGSGGYATKGTAIYADDEFVADLAGTDLGHEHLALDVCAAATGAELLLGKPVGGHIAPVAAAYRSLPSRMERVITVGGVLFVDDALASNPTGTAASARSYASQPVGIILGGTDRNVGFEDLFAELAGRSAPTMVVLFSDNRTELTALAERASVRHLVVDSDDVAEATRTAFHALAADGGVVLFSPASATPTRQGNYRDRSRTFQATARALAGA
jgi:UDP-N-acetylmuramoyl-L-alanine---L-glutamate ligase